MEACSPLIGRHSILDQRAQRLIEAVHAAEAEKAEGLPTDDERDEKRRRRVELTKEEMFAQPAAIQRTLALESVAIGEAAKKLAGRSWRRVYLVGCGDSLAAAVALRLLFERVLGVACEAMQSLDFAYYYSEIADKDSLVICLSSSGETTRTLEAALVARERGSTTVAVTNTAESSLMREAEHALLVHATRRGWPTQASTAAMALLARLVLEIGGYQGRTGWLHEANEELARVPDLLGRVLDRCDRPVAALAQKYSDRNIFLYAGGGPAFACAMFGAAKMKECTPAHAIAIPLEEYHHYNSQKKSDPLLLFVPRGRTMSRALDTARAGKRAGGNVHVATSVGETRFARVADSVLHLPIMREEIAPIVYCVPGQLFAYYVAVERFRLADAK